ncbi:glycosyl transferase family 1 [Limnohabitans sp. MMS-10A-160]|uniref:glycosyltransferase n=1 Tax=unclassified Limnohabitans TaxID=2626134 RepID=UPI000D393279|nr:MULTISPECIES: glycosyltransferase [unclassified Limnohabitans]PUE19631.1 glycosyl transferase family 1 [Limnohabitans sp. MMS-10A-192]PUE26992.1 glycosyl transferase family 1 [Limnohabitans sp. MMS-10A-160]
MKILFVITGLGVGGAERQVVDIADRLAVLGHEVKIAYLTGPSPIRPNSEKVEIVGMGMKKTVSGFFHAYFGLRNLIHSFKPAVVHSHMVHANILTRLVRLSCRIPRLVCTAHSTNEGGKLRMLAYRLTTSLANISTNVSVEAVTSFEAQGAVARGKMIAIPNGIDVERFKSEESIRIKIRKQVGVAENEKVVIAVGRLHEAKDYPNLFRAFANVMLITNNVRLWIIGDGDLRSNLSQEVKKLGIENKVNFFGVQSKISDWMNGADVFVLSSAWEGFGLVVAEAMACEKVVVATDAGGVKEVLGDCGFLVPTRDSKLLSEALVRALALSSSEAQALGADGRQRVLTHFSLDFVVQRWLAIYKSNLDFN